MDRGWEVTVNLGEGLPGKELLQLLSSIKEAGSLNRAAREAGLSYRYAWGLLNKVEETLGQRLVLRKTGGMAGGGTTLTDAGRRLLEYLLALQRETSLQMGAVLAGANQDKGSRQLVLASSMEPVVTGLLDVLEQAYLLQSGTVLRHVAAGSGQAFALARAGRADLVLTHAPELEEKFMDEGWGTRRVPVMVNDYVLVGPVTDPAGICAAKAVVQALQKMAARRAFFVSRADSSGTHLLEMKLWREAGIVPAGEPWYRACRNVLGSYGVLQQAGQLPAYTLVDRASFLTGNSGTALKVCVEGDAVLENIFSVMPVSRTKVPVDQEEAEQFADWLAGPAAQKIIDGFGRQSFGYPLFRPIW